MMIIPTTNQFSVDSSSGMHGFFIHKTLIAYFWHRFSFVLYLCLNSFQNTKSYLHTSQFSTCSLKQFTIYSLDKKFASVIRAQLPWF